MAGLATAGRLCQPTNPPPKRYKPPLMTKAKQNGNLQRYNINAKISDPCCGASTYNHVAIYSHNSTNPRKPTMTSPKDGLYPTLSKNGEKYATETVSMNDIIRNDNSMQGPTTLQPTNQLPVNRNLCLTPYRPPKMRKSTSPTTPKPPSPNTTMQISTQLTPLQNHNPSQLNFMAGTTNHASVTHNTIHSTVQFSNLIPNTATTTQHPPIPVNHIQATTTVSTIPSHSKTADNTQHPKPRPHDRHTISPPSVYQPDPTLHLTNSMVANNPAPLPCSNPSNAKINDPALASRHKNCPFSPTIKDPQVFKSALPSTEPQNPLTALNEVISSINEKLTRLLSIYALLSIIIPSSMTESF